MGEAASRRSSILKWSLWIGAAGFVLFVVGGFFIAPPFVRARILREMSKRLGREVSVGKVTVNPFEISATIHDLRIKDKDGAPFASWDEGTVNYRFTSFLSRDFVFDEVRFVKPYARFVIEKDGSLNIDDLIRIVRADADRDRSGPPARWTFLAVHIEEARIGVTDRMRTPTFESTVGPFRLDLTGFSTNPNSESPYSFAGSTESGETFSWSGRITSDPLRSTGTLTLGGVKLPKYQPYYESERAFLVRDGQLAVSGKYDVSWSDTEKKLLVQDGHMELTGGKISRPGTGEPDVQIDRLTIDGADVDGMRRTAKIASVTLDGGHVVIRHDADKTVNLYEMMRPWVAPSPAPPAAPSAGPAPTPPPTPKIAIDRLSIVNVTVDAEDLEPERPFKVTAHDCSLDMSGLDTDRATLADVKLSARLDENGRIDAKGSFSADFHRGDLDVDVADVDVRPTDTYLAPYAKVRIASGRVASKGHVAYEMPPRGDLQFSFKGDLTVSDLSLVHAETAAELARWAVFKLAPMDVRLNPMRIDVGEAAIGAPRLAVTMAPDRTIDLTSALTPVATAPPESPSTLPEFRVGVVRVRNGIVAITDKSVEPGVATTLASIDGTVKGISSEELSRAAVDLSAKLDGVAPVAITGQINPIARKDFTDLAVSADGIDLLPFSPYSGKYLGYTLANGKMAAKMSYKIAERRFTSENLFTIDHMQLGEKTASPDAVHLPVKLAVAVLRDKNGQIVLDVPAEGSVDDPEFRLGRVIAHAIVNVLTKIVTSPFRLIANALGHKDVEIEYQDFRPGSADLGDPEKQKLDLVAQSLADKPDLMLDVDGRVDPTADGDAMKRARLDGLVRTEKWKVASKTDPSKAAPESVTIPVEEYATWLQAAYKTAFPSEPPADPPLGSSEMEAKLLGTIAIGPDDLRALAAARARTVRDYLTTTGKVAAERVFLAEAKAGTERPPAPRVWLDLK